MTLKINNFNKSIDLSIIHSFSYSISVLWSTYTPEGMTLTSLPSWVTVASWRSRCLKAQVQPQVQAVLNCSLLDSHSQPKKAQLQMIKKMIRENMITVIELFGVGQMCIFFLHFCPSTKNFLEGAIICLFVHLEFPYRYTSMWFF